MSTLSIVLFCLIIFLVVLPKKFRRTAGIVGAVAWLAFVFGPFICSAGMGGPIGLQVIAGSTVASGGGITCTTADDSLLLSTVAVAADAAANFSPESDSRAFVQSLQVTGTGTFMLTEIVTRCARVNSANNAYVSVYTDNAGEVGSEISGSGVSVAWSGISSSAQLCSFVLSSPIGGLDCNTQYWVFFFTDGADPDGKFYADSTGEYANGLIGEDLSYPSTWDYSTRAAMDMYVDLYGCYEQAQ